MALEDVVVDMTNDYINWCADALIKPEKEQVNSFIDMILDSLRKTHKDGTPGRLILEGKNSGRKEEIVLSTRNEYCYIKAFGIRYKISLDEVKKIPETQIKYNSEEHQKLWAHCYRISPETMPFAKEIYERVYEHFDKQ